MSTDDQTNHLAAIPGRFADPDPSLVSKLPKGKKDSAPPVKCQTCGGFHPGNWIHLDFVGHADLTLMLISVDPLWTWEPMSLTPEGTPCIKEHNGTLSMWGRLTVLGKTMIGVGTCDAAKQDAEKELIGDFLRNAAMRFGFCTKLWSKVDAMPEAPPPDGIPGGPHDGAAKSAPKGAPTPTPKAPTVPSAAKPNGKSVV